MKISYECGPCFLRQAKEALDNTLIFDNEVESLLKYIDFLHSSGVDAVIMQDIGMIDLVRKTYPNLEIHASTQMHIHNLDGTLFRVPFY